MTRANLAVASLWARKSVLVVSPTPTYPIDFGNRRRIFHVCQRIKELGASITFLHYPGEADWRERISLDTQHAMMSQWDNYYVAPVTQPLHMPPQHGAFHQIDEWWDPGIGDMLRWIFATHRFDVVIVNYTWLSKALEFVPEGTIRILDTHDRFAGRREVLEANGIAPEFFYTSEEQERIALGRADVVWAIKKEEENLFRALTDRQVLTLLHAEPVVPRYTRKPGEVITFGMVGARNNINVRNFTNFLDVAHAYLRRTLLPCEIVVAGTCCDLLRVGHLPFVRLLGRVDTMDEFYDSVDIVLGPMSFSTGLKIKIGEAMSYGKGVIAHSHCFEGYIPTHRFQTLPSFQDMMRACAAVVRDRSLIDELEHASRQSMHDAGRQVAEALERSLEQAQQVEPALIITLHARELSRHSLLLDHAVEAAEYIAHQMKVAFYIEGPATAVEPQAIQRLRCWGSIICSPGTAEALGSRLGAAMGSQSVPVMAFRKLMEADHPGVWFTCIPADFPARRRPLPMTAFIPVAALAQSVPDVGIIHFAEAASQVFEEAVAFDTTLSSLLAATGSLPVTRRAIPFLWRGHASQALRILTSQERRMVTLLSRTLESDLLDLALEVCRLTTDRRVEVVYDAASNSATEHGAARDRHRDVVFTPLQDYVQVVEKRQTAAYLVAELGEDSIFAVLRELMHRGCVPLVQLFIPGHTAMMHDEEAPRWREAGRLASVDLLSELLMDDQRVEILKQFRIERYGYANDAGWALIWSLVQKLGGVDKADP
ncbi:glycosyltransferase [Teichococcus rhizosphaerae]|nr:glycosyltransferase [Pseudoroseomonas rhizosphaerae]